MKTSVECNAGGHDSCPRSSADCSCECHLALSDFDKPETTEEPTYPEAQLLAPVYTDAHWAIEKAIEIDNDVRTIIPNAEAILAFLKEHAYGSAEETEVLYNMNEEPLHTVTKPRGSWK